MEKLVIEIGNQAGDIVVREGEQVLSGILSLKLEADVIKIPPILHIELPTEDTVPVSMKESIAHTIEVIQRHGGQVTFIAPPEIETNPEDQDQAEGKLKNMIT